MPIPPNKFTRATFKALPNGPAVTVHFNPTTLNYTVENSVPQKAGRPKTAQYVARFSGKLTMDLQFDTSDTGSDVRLVTNNVAAFMQPGALGSGSPSTSPPVLEFTWGTYTFRGVLEQFKEVVDYFSADGVALRALVSISLSRQEDVFTNNGQPANSASSGSSPGGSAPGGSPPGGSVVPTGAGGSAASAAQQGGDPSAARQLASDNDLESMRFSDGASLQVGGGVQLNASAGFSVSASAGIGASGGLGIGVSAGAGISAGASAGFGVSASGGALFGANASAGVPATAGAFTGLETGRATVSSTSRLDTSMMLRSTIGSDVSTSAGATFSLGGAAQSTSSAGLSANVGAGVSFGAGLSFEGD